MKLTVLFTKVSTILFISSFFNTITAQLSLEDNAFYQKAVDNVVSQYYKSLGEQSRLYNGRQYEGFVSSFKEGHPFFYSSTLSKGSIVYDNVFYSDIQMLYDEVNDVIVIQDATHRLQLHSERVSQFSILDNKFIRLVKESPTQDVINTGFYQIIQEGDVWVLKKEIKTIEENINSTVEGVVRSIKAQTHYFIKKDGVFFSIKKEKDVLVVFKDQEKEIRQFIVTNQLNFKKDSDNMLLKVSAYYNSLNK